MSDEPISDLDQSIDALVRALGQTPDLDGLIRALEAYGQLMAFVEPDNPAAVDALSVGLVWESLAATAREVQALKEIRDGRT